MKRKVFNLSIDDMVINGSDKKSQLQKEYIEIMKSKKKDNSKKYDEYNISKSENEELIVNRKKDKAQSKICNECKKIKKTLKDSKQYISELKKIRYEQGVEINNLISENKDKDNEILKLKEELNNIREIVSNKDNEICVLKGINDKHKFELNRRKSIIKNADKMIGKYGRANEERNNLNKQLDTCVQKNRFLTKDNIRTKNKLKECSTKLEYSEKKIDRINKINATLNSRINQYRKNIEVLEGIIEEAVSGEIGISDLEIKFLNVKYVDKPSKRLEKNALNCEESKTFEENIELNEQVGEVAWGYVKVKEGNQYMFCDLNSEAYPLVIKDEFLFNIEDSVPCKVYIRDEMAYLISISFDDMDLEESKNLKSSKDYKDIKKKNKKKYLDNRISFNKEKVLLIGARNKERYTNYLEAHNLDVTWVDAYEGGLGRVDAECGKNDCVLILTSHCRHSIKDKILSQKDFFEGNIKYQFIKNDNEDNLIYRINYILANMNNKSDLKTKV